MHQLCHNCDDVVNGPDQLLGRVAFAVDLSQCRLRRGKEYLPEGHGPVLHRCKGRQSRTR